MAAAADKRLQQEESRGMKDPEGYKRKLEQREKLENQSNTAGTGEAPLKVSFINDNIHLHLFQKDLSDMLGTFIARNFILLSGGKCHEGRILCVKTISIVLFFICFML